MATADDLPSRAEQVAAYGAAATASLVWVAAVLPGVHLVEPGLPDDLATPMHRGALLIVPALLLLVAAPIASLLATHPLGLRSLLVLGNVFVTLYTAVVLVAQHPKGIMLAAVVALASLGAVAVRDAWILARAGASDPVQDVPPSYTDLRLSLAILALLTPTSLLSLGAEERASWFAPFFYVAVSALGERFARGPRGLRLTAAVCLAILGGHLAIAMRFVLDAGEPASAGWTLAGHAAFLLSCAVLLLCLAWGGILLKERRAPQGPA